MRTKATEHEINAFLIDRYRNLESPWYGWVKEAYKADPYRTVVDALAQFGAKVTDETDLNYEVSCRYYIRMDDEFLIAELSLVARYAVVLDAQAVSPEDIVTAETARTPLARKVLQVLDAHGLTVLDSEILQTPVSMPFTNVEAGEGTFYQALIADTPGPFQS